MFFSNWTSLFPWDPQLRTLHRKIPKVAAARWVPASRRPGLLGNPLKKWWTTGHNSNIIRTYWKILQVVKWFRSVSVKSQWRALFFREIQKVPSCLVVILAAHQEGEFAFSDGSDDAMQPWGPGWPEKLQVVIHRLRKPKNVPFFRSCQLCQLCSLFLLKAIGWIPVGWTLQSLICVSPWQLYF